jgi:hypothetical protein
LRQKNKIEEIPKEKFDKDLTLHRVKHQVATIPGMSKPLPRFFSFAQIIKI